MEIIQKRLIKVNDPSYFSVGPCRRSVVLLRRLNNVQHIHVTKTFVSNVLIKFFCHYCEKQLFKKKCIRICRTITLTREAPPHSSALVPSWLSDSCFVTLAVVMHLKTRRTAFVKAGENFRWQLLFLSLALLIVHYTDLFMFFTLYCHRVIGVKAFPCLTVNCRSKSGEDTSECHKIRKEEKRKKSNAFGLAVTFCSSLSS